MATRSRSLSRRQCCTERQRGLHRSINVEGVRLSLVGSGRDNITASVTGTGDVRLLGGANTVTVMNSIVDELTTTASLLPRH